MNRQERRQQARADARLLAQGIDLTSADPEPTAELSRSLHALFETAKRTGNIDPPVALYQAQIEASLDGLRISGLACRKGCSHCCHVWVSATAPELLYIAKILLRRGGPAPERVAAAHAATRDEDVEARGRHPRPCPMLVDDACSIHPFRPKSCRFAASFDAAICRRSYLEGGEETIPMPERYAAGRGIYAIALTCALLRAGLPVHAYEFNAGLACALARPDAEAAWLSGEDVFAAVRRDPNDILAWPPTRLVYRRAFPG